MRKYYERKFFCEQCGAELTGNLKFCPNCGKKIFAKSDKNLSVNIKKLGLIAATFVLLIVLSVTGIKMIPKLLITPEELMLQGNYEKAYKKAKEDKKENVLIENLIIHICNEIKKSMKDPSSFELRDVWYEPEENKRIVLYVSGRNSFGGIVGSLYVYYFGEGKYELLASIHDMEEEEYYSFDDTYDILEKMFNNMARNAIREVRVDSNKLDGEVVDRINELNKEDIMKNVRLLNEVKSIYPLENGSSL